MNFEGAKENIQPLATGRNIERLEVAINAESHPEYQQALNEQRKQFEQSIANYEGDDPLDLWFEYVSWIEQSYPSGKESAITSLLTKCLSKFERDDRYTQDPRLVRLFIKYIDTQKDPQQYYQKLYNKGVGTMVADLYIAWAHYYDIVDNYDLAEQVYQKGIAARATPTDQLKQALDRFHFSISQRVLGKDDYRQEFLTSMQERRNAFTSLRSYKSSMVGSIRTGSAVKSYEPGRVKQNPSLAKSSKNVSINVYEGSSIAATSNPHNPSTSVVEDIQNSMMENKVEPGPWSNALKLKKKSVCRYKSGQKPILGFAILEDSDDSTIPIKFSPLPDDNDYDIRLPENFARKNSPQREINVPLYIEESREPNVLPSYDFLTVHPNKDQSFSIEEAMAYRYFKKLNKSNRFTKAQEKIWGIDSKVPMRRPPMFARKNQPQSEFKCEVPDIAAIPVTERFCCKLKQLYPGNRTEEFSFEELMKQQLLDAQADEVMMDETVCVKGRQSFGVQYTRKSIYSHCNRRKSIIPVAPDINCVVDMDMDVDIDKELYSETKQHETNQNMGELYVFQDERSQYVTSVVSTFKDTYKTGELTENLTVFADSATSSNVTRNAVVEEATTPVSSKMQFKWAVPVNKPKHMFAVPNAKRPSSSLNANKDVEVEAATTPVALTMQDKWAVPVNKPKHTFAVPNSKRPSSSLNANKDVEVEEATTPVALTMQVNKPMFAVPNAKRPSSSIDINKDVEIEGATTTVGLIMQDKSEIPMNKSKHVFVVPKFKPLTDKDTLETVSVRDDVNTEPPQKKRTPNDVPHFTIGPHTGAIKKSLRKSTITENAIQHAGPQFAAIVSGISSPSNDENTFKSPELFDHERTMGQENADFDYTLCTQNFNIRLMEKMVSTPLQPRRQEALQEQIIKPDAAPTPQLSQKLSIIMETTEGSGHTASTKSSLQFSSPEDEATSKPSNFMNQTKFISEHVDSDGNSSGSSVNNSKSNRTENEKKGDDEEEKEEEGEEEKEEDCNEKSFAFPFKIYEDPMQIDVKSNVSQSTNHHFKSNVAAGYCNDESSIPAIQFSVLATSKYIDQTMEKQSPTLGTDNVSDTGKNERTIEKEPVNPYPFPIFEDAPITKTTCQIDSLLDFFATTPNSSLKKSKTPPSRDPQNVNDFSTIQPTSRDPHNVNDFSTIQPTVSKMSAVVTNPNITDCVNRSEANVRNYPSRLELPSLHIKEEPEESVIIVSPTESSRDNFDDDYEQSFVIPKIAEIQSLALDKECKKLSISDTKETSCVKDTSTGIKLSISFNTEELKLNSFKDAVTKAENQNLLLEKTFEINDPIALTSEDDDDIVEIVDTDEEVNCDQSIYFKQNSVCLEPSWIDHNLNEVIEDNNDYQVQQVNLEESKFIIDTKLAQISVDPFDLELRKALLDEVDIVSYFQKSDTCQLVNKVPPLSLKGTIKFKDMQFDIVNAIGQGAYGRVFSVKSRKDGKMYAVKKEIPANIWEYYICTEVHCRIASERISHGYMNVNYGIVGNNGSILFSEYSPYGTLLDVCNRVFTSSQRHVDESIVFILAHQMLDIIDHLHGSGILHLDLKPDNFLVMKKLSSDYRDLFIQLIDFGNSVDLERFAKGQKFNAAVETKNFICIEMMERRPWIHQPDLFCLAGTVHSVLFGRYMEVEKKSSGDYEIKMKIKRYFNQHVWEKFFKKLINIKDSHSKPDLQEMKEMFVDAIDNDRNLLQKINQFNTYISK